jgi:hypothetical protein
MFYDKFYNLFAPEPALKDQGGRIYTDQQQIAQLLAQHFKDLSDSDEYTLDFRKIKDKEEQRQMDMEDLEWEEYNEPYKLEKLEYALGSCDGSSPGPDGMH